MKKKTVTVTSGSVLAVLFALFLIWFLSKD